MRRRRAPLQRAVDVAREALALRGIRSPEEIDLVALIADYRIALRRGHIGNAEGRLVRSGRRAVMTIDESAFASEKWLFVAAHELGHFLLHLSRVDLTCFRKKGASREDRSRSFLDEEAASSCGVELLTPAEMVLARYDRAAPALERARSIAGTFGVSLPTAALRVLDFTEEPCAVAYSERGALVWCTATRAFGVDVPKRAAGRRESGARAVRATSWGKPSAGVEEILEQSVALAPFDAVVTVLTHGTP